MEWYKGIACVTYKELTEGDPKSEKETDWPVMSEATYRIMATRGKMTISRRACYETPALISFKSLPLKYREAFIRKYGDPEKVTDNRYLNDAIEMDPRAENFFAGHIKPNGEHLTPEQIRIRTMNASILNAVDVIMQDRLTMRKALGSFRTTADAWRSISKVVNALPSDKKHSLPKNYRRLKDKLERYKANGYAEFIHKCEGNSNAAKVKEDEQNAVLQELASDGRNLDNEMVASLYNVVAKKLGWDTICAGTVANWREKNPKVQYVGRHGATAHRNNKAMQVRRTAPKAPLYYWTVDGWDAELLFQKRITDKNGRSLVTYHNRPTVVMILDPCTEYPVGYAIGSHETPELIRLAFRNAFKHVKELFGNYYKPLQLQTDNYGRGNLTPFYEACTKIYTPAGAKNAKAKIIEPFFKQVNSKYCHLMPNWSGYGVTSKKSLQPNSDWLNQNRHKFPDEQRCIEQIEGIIRVIRSEKIEKYRKAWEQMPEEDRLVMSTEEYLVLFGETTGRGNKLEGGGLKPTILGEAVWYDSFDSNFRNYGHLNWIVKYDPEDLSQAVAIENTGTSQKPQEGTRRFMLERKYIQPMALKERQDGDATELQRILEFNKQEENAIIMQRANSGKVVRQLFEERPELNDTLAKFVLCDSRGQHKNERNRIAGRTEEKQRVHPEANDTEYEEVFDEEDLLRQF